MLNEKKNKGVIPMSSIKGYDTMMRFTNQSQVDNILLDTWHGTDSPFFMG